MSAYKLAAICKAAHKLAENCRKYYSLFQLVTTDEMLSKFQEGKFDFCIYTKMKPGRCINKSHFKDKERQEQNKGGQSLTCQIQWILLNKQSLP